MIAGLWMGMEMHGFDLNPRLVDRIQDVVDEHLPDGNLHPTTTMESECCHWKERKNPLMPSLLTPYLNCPDLYTEEPEDLSNMKQPEWEDMMRKAFKGYHRLLKRSTVKDKTFYPLMMRMTADPTEEAWTAAMGEALDKAAKASRRHP